VAKLFLLRHGETVANKERKYCGFSETPMLQEAIEDLKNLSSVNAEIVFSSPLKRCLDTAKYLGYDNIIVSELLKETNFGRWENKCFDEIQKESPILANGYLHKPLTFKFPNGESVKDSRERAKKFISDELKEELSKELTVMIISHAGILKLLLMELLHLELSFFWNVDIKPGRFTVLEYFYQRDDICFVLQHLNVISNCY